MVSLASLAQPQKYFKRKLWKLERHLARFIQIVTKTSNLPIELSEDEKELFTEPPMKLFGPRNINFQIIIKLQIRPNLVIFNHCSCLLLKTLIFASWRLVNFDCDLHMICKIDIHLNNVRKKV